MTSCIFERAIVVGASGSVGRLLAVKLRHNVHHLVRIDLVAGADQVVGDVLQMSPAVCDIFSQADLVVLALPHAVLERAIPIVSALLAPTSIIVETASVKASLGRAVEALAQGPAIMGINPMFGPSIGFDGEAVLLVQHREGAGPSERFVMAMEGWGARILAVSAAEHDSMVAVLQAACHAVVLGFGEALRLHGLTPKLLAAATPPARLLLLLLSRILTGSSGTYWEVQADNEYAARARAAVVAGIAHIDRLVLGADAAGFVAWLDALRVPLSNDLSRLAPQAAAMLASLDPV